MSFVDPEPWSTYYKFPLGLVLDLQGFIGSLKDHTFFHQGKGKHSVAVLLGANIVMVRYLDCLMDSTRNTCFAQSSRMNLQNAGRIQHYFRAGGLQ